MKKIATGFGCVALLVCVFYQSVEAVFGLPAYLVAGPLFLLSAVGLSWGGIRAAFGVKSHAFDHRVTDGGFLN